MEMSEMKEMLYHVDHEAVGGEMVDILMDDDVKTYDMFEDLVTAYTDEKADSSFRAGMDKALEILTWMNMNSIAERMQQYVIEKDVAV